MRYRELALEDLHDELRQGRLRTYEDDTVTEVINRALQTSPPDGSTQRSARSLATATGHLQDHRSPLAADLLGAEPHRQTHFKLSTDPFFLEKVRDIVGLYLNPPDNAMVLCVDERTQIQALDLTHPLLPMGLGYVEGGTNDYIRYGTTTLFADTAAPTTSERRRWPSCALSQSICCVAAATARYAGLSQVSLRHQGNAGTGSLLRVDRPSALRGPS